MNATPDPHARTRAAPDDFAWRPPPCEYDFETMPIDILWGSGSLREGIDAGVEADEILGVAPEALARFAKAAGPHELSAHEGGRPCGFALARTARSPVS